MALNLGVLVRYGCKPCRFRMPCPIYYVTTILFRSLSLGSSALPGEYMPSQSLPAWAVLGVEAARFIKDVLYSQSHCASTACGVPDTGVPGVGVAGTGLSGSDLPGANLPFVPSLPGGNQH